AAPVGVEATGPTEALECLSVHASDGCERWDALQTLLGDEVRRLAGNPAAPPAEGLVALFGELIDRALALGDDPEGRFMLANMLTLPDETYLFQQFDVVDVDRVCDA